MTLEAMVSDLTPVFNMIHLILINIEETTVWDISVGYILYGIGFVAQTLAFREMLLTQ